MKRKTSAPNVIVQRPSLRRATRSNSTNVAAPKEKVTSTAGHHGHIKPRSNLTVISEIITIDDENPETNVNSNKKPNQKPDRKAKHEISPKVSIDVTTPKSKYVGLHQSSERTPFKDDLLTCSQTDPQSDVNWDCTSPDALRFLRKGRRRRHESDVSDIVNQLLVPEEEEVHEDAKTTSTPPLLGLWMKGNSRVEDQLNRTTLTGKSNRLRRKEKCQSSRGRGSSMQQDLVEKLKQAVNKYDDIQEEAELCEDREPVISTLLEKPTISQVFDQSKDLFENTQITETASQSQKKEISPQQGDGKPLDIDRVRDDNCSDISWSDDDIFNDESFLIKATQGTRCKTPVNANRGFKRKSEYNNSSEPLKKTGKLNLKDSAPVQQTKTHQVLSKKNASQGKTGSVGTTNKNTSTTDRTCNMKSVTTVHKNLGGSSTKCSTDTDTLFLGSQTKSCSKLDTSNKIEKHSFLPKNNIGMTTKPEGPNNCISNKKGSEDIQHNRNTGCDKLTNVANCQSGDGFTLHKTTLLGPRGLTSSLVRTCDVTKNQVSDSNNSGSNTQQVSGNVSCLNTARSGNYIPYLPDSKTTNSDTRDRKYSNRNTAQQSVSCHSNYRDKAGVLSVQDNKNVITSSSKSPDISKQKYNVDHGANSERTLVSPVLSSVKRRSLGLLDTSLTEDLLCQLAEPDEILESQVSPRSAVLKVKPDDKGTAANMVPRKLDQPVDCKTSSSGIQTSNSKKEISSTSINRTNPVPASCVSTGNAKKLQSSSWVISKTVPSQSSKLKASSVSQQDVKPKTVAVSGAANSAYQCKTSSVQGTSSIPGARGNLDKKTEVKNSVCTQSKYTFKSSQMLKTGGTFLTSVKGKATTDSIPQSSAVSFKSRQMAKTSDNPFAENSEDLFASDEEDDLSESHILAMLDTVEMQATQAVNKPCKEKLQTEMDKKSSSLNQNPGNTGKCSSDEIERKRQAALERRQKKNNLSCSQSPVKYSPEEIEQKRQDAIRKRNKSSSYSPYGKVSPGKCSPEEIEVKRQRAVEKRKKLTFDWTASCDSHDHVSSQNLESEPRKESESSPGFSSSQSGDSSSPFKCTPDEIEKKKQAALQRRKEILKVKGNLNKDFSSTTHNFGSYPRR